MRSCKYLNIGLDHEEVGNMLIYNTFVSRDALFVQQASWVSLKISSDDRGF